MHPFLFFLSKATRDDLKEFPELLTRNYSEPYRREDIETIERYQIMYM